MKPLPCKHCEDEVYPGARANHVQLLHDLYNQGTAIQRIFRGFRVLKYPQRLLDHLQEAKLFTAKDLVSIFETLDSMRETLARGKERHSPHLLKLLQNRINNCEKLLEDLKAHVASISPEIVPIQEKLISILRSMAAANTRSKVRLG